MDGLLLNLLSKTPYTNMGARSKIGELVKAPPMSIITIRRITDTVSSQRRLAIAQEQRKNWWE